MATEIVIRNSNSRRGGISADNIAVICFQKNYGHIYNEKKI